MAGPGAHDDPGLEESHLGLGSVEGPVLGAALVFCPTEVVHVPREGVRCRVQAFDPDLEAVDLGVQAVDLGAQGIHLGLQAVDLPLDGLRPFRKYLGHGLQGGEALAGPVGGVAHSLGQVSDGCGKVPELLGEQDAAQLIGPVGLVPEQLDQVLDVVYGGHWRLQPPGVIVVPEGPLGERWGSPSDPCGSRQRYGPRATAACGEQSGVPAENPCLGEAWS